MDNESQRIWKEAFVDILRCYPHLTGRIEEIQEKAIMIVGDPIEIRIGGLPNTSLVLYLKTNMLVGQTLKQIRLIKEKFKRSWVIRNE